MASNYSYPLLPPGFGYSQNTSVADGTSIGVLNEEDTALTPTVPSSHAMQAVPAVPAVPAVQTMQSVQTVQTVQAGTTGQEKPRRSMKLKNKVYFQLLEVTNDLQKRLSQRGAPMTKLNSAAVARLARYVNEVEDTPAALQALQKAFASVLPSINLCSQEEFASFVSKIRVALNK